MATEQTVFIPHLTECWAPAQPLGPNKFKLLQPCDMETTPDLHEIVYDKAAWAKLKALPNLSTLPAFEDAASVYAAVVDPLEGKDNIAELQSVSEASVIHSVKIRYTKDAIYTNVGKIVIALNPFRGRPDLYSATEMERYHREQNPFTLSPHIFQIAAAAYNGLRDDGISQSTLITGESGND